MQHLKVPDDFPQFVVPGHDDEMRSIRELYYLHYQRSGPLIPLWDEWLPNATLWPATDLDKMRQRWADALASRGMDEDGYVFTHQHDGTAHAFGWPFPLWQQGGGIGWHFVGTGVQGYDAPHVKPDDWTVTRATSGEINDKGWQVDLTAPQATAQTPRFKVEAKHAPWLRLNWWVKGLENAHPYIEWTTEEAPEFSLDRRVAFKPATVGVDGGETRTMIAMYKLPQWKGTITNLRIGFDNAAAAKVVIKSVHTAYDSRHPVNNLNFIRGAHDYFMWTGDVKFLAEQMPRIRKAMHYVMSEFQTRTHKCIYNTWPGHEGRSGVRYVNGKKEIVFGEGIGSNYWDLLPFGGEDSLATIYYYDALKDLAELEEYFGGRGSRRAALPIDAQTARTEPRPPFDPDDLRAHAEQVRAYGQKRFWNQETGRFGTVDLDGAVHDYGFTFLNCEAIYYDFASRDQTKSIMQWIDGERTVAGDTSTGKDIYHWRFGPRSTTKRNIDYYFWAWSNPESIPFGDQVQDGGAVLGWSYHDLMARIKTLGADSAAARLSEIAKWFDDVQREGGYRKYYSVPGRGTLQGGNVPGGLGLDKEFFESILPPQVMVYGFLGLTPGFDTLVINPQLPKDWPSLSVTQIHWRNLVLDITATRDRIEIQWRGTSDGQSHVEGLNGRRATIPVGSEGKITLQ
ncbi:MAG TPA: glycosyl hydrolase family 65 protein [Tepidisphaeraceae bacterium]|jgi:hypothetical protein|nr:glycosyl hydrolase family 65 protein [Tepidisphaeraceae bacterium]